MLQHPRGKGSTSALMHPFGGLPGILKLCVTLQVVWSHEAPGEHAPVHHRMVVPVQANPVASPSYPIV